MGFYVYAICGDYYSYGIDRDSISNWTIGDGLMDIGYVIKDTETEEYFTGGQTTTSELFTFNLVYAHIYSNINLADIANINGKYFRWKDGYRVTRKLSVVEVEIKETD